MVQLIAENLSVGYDGKAVLRDLNFEIPAGDYLCIIGENGSGKSTLMKTVLGLLPPVSGEIRTDGSLRKNEIGYLPQQTDIQKDFPASVGEIVLSGCQGRSGRKFFYGRKEKRIAAENMERMGIKRLEHTCYRVLSGGQQQRVLLARALCAAEKMILLDEPAAGLDPKAAAQMYDLAAELNRAGTTIVMVSHDMEAAARFAKHILYAGKTYFYGTKQKYLEREGNQKVKGGDIGC
jgi:zinc transport system ATP-binding protein